MENSKNYIIQAFIATIFTICLLRHFSPNILNRVMMTTGNERLANVVAIAVPFICGFVIFIVLPLIAKMIRIKKTGSAK